MKLRWNVDVLEVVASEEHAWQYETEEVKGGAVRTCEELCDTCLHLSVGSGRRTAAAQGAEVDVSQQPGAPASQVRLPPCS